MRSVPDFTHLRENVPELQKKELHLFDKNCFNFQRSESYWVPPSAAELELMYDNRVVVFVAL